MWQYVGVLVLCLQHRLLSKLQPNMESVGELWLGLLRFYTEEFDFKEHVISIRQKKRLTTFEKQWTSKCIAIEGELLNLSSSPFQSSFLSLICSSPQIPLIWIIILVLEFPVKVSILVQLLNHNVFHLSPSDINSARLNKEAPCVLKNTILFI